jgi:hypothetical protein
VRRALPAVLAAVAALAAAAPAAADPATGARVRALAARAIDDPGALAALRRIDRIDGRPAAVGSALDGARGEELASRLRSLAAVGGGDPGVGDAGARARAVLAERRFQEAPVPRPFRGLLRQIARPLDPVLDALGPAAAAVGRAWPLLALGLAALAAVFLARALRRPARAGVARAPAGPGQRPQSPEELDRLAEAAERDGRLEAALRLRFRAGLRRLERSRAIPPRPSLLSSEVSRRLRSPAFDRLAATFDEVAYGARPARPDDLAAARAGWQQVEAEAGGR